MFRNQSSQVFLISLGLVLGIGLGTGLLIGYVEGYGDAIGGTFEPDLQFDTAQTAEEYSIDGYKIRLQNWNITEENGKVGYTTRHNDIYIRTNRSIREIYTTCVHEKLHNQYPNKEHSWIYTESRERIDNTCLKLLTQIQSHRSS